MNSNPVSPQSSPRWRRIASQLPLGFTAGIPLFLSGQTLSKWLADSGVDIKSVGLFALVSLPYNVKFLWAPLLDRYVPPFLGRRRGWIAVFTLATAIAIAIASTFDPSAELQSLAVAAIAIATLSASLDIVIDAYRTDTLEDGERGRGTALYLFGYRGAMLVSGSVALLAADRIGWQATYLALAAALAFGSLSVFFAPPTTNDSHASSLSVAIVRPLAEFFTRSGAGWLLAAVLLYRLGDGFVDQLLLPFLGESGFSNDEIAAVQKGMGLAATIVGVGIGGVLTDRLGILRSLFLFGLLAACANTGYLLLATSSSPSLTNLIVAVCIDNLCNGFGFAALVAFLMAACDRRYSATQYALFTSASSILGKLLGSVSGYLQASFGWPSLFLISVLAAGPALAILVVARKSIGNALGSSGASGRARP